MPLPVPLNIINNTGMSAECAIWQVCPWVGSGLPASEGEHCMSPLLEILLPAQLLEHGSSVCCTKHSSRTSLPFWDFRHWKEVVGDPKSEAERAVCCTARVWDMHIGGIWNRTQKSEVWTEDITNYSLSNSEQRGISCSCLLCLDSASPIAGKASVVGIGIRHWKQYLNNIFTEFNGQEGSLALLVWPLRQHKPLGFTQAALYKAQ